MKHTYILVDMWDDEVIAEVDAADYREAVDFFTYGWPTWRTSGYKVFVHVERA